MEIVLIKTLQQYFFLGEIHGVYCSRSTLENALEITENLISKQVLCKVRKKYLNRSTIFNNISEISEAFFKKWFSFVASR